ncbi:TetR/AcrR family transcriptional regulator [Variovorax sp. AFSI2.2]|uniref:TetR/AcrR family transcriptional regulator n=1 Tax=Variovorax sp. AFSI2.2 TaxID=3384160 RepID=UPI003EBAA091
MKIKDSTKTNVSAARGTLSAPKRPKQERGIARFNKLLDAADTLLATHELDEVGLYQIAQEAGAPPASVYHFFPSPQAVLIALAERYHQKVADVSLYVEPGSSPTWQELLRQRLSSTVKIFNHHPTMQKLFLGSHANHEMASSEVGFNEMLAQRFVSFYDQFFHMPVITGIEQKFLVMLTLLDAVMRLSYAKHRTITAEFEAEAALAAIAYCRTFLPEVIELRAAKRAVDPR